MYSKLSDRDDWFDLWFEDKKSILQTMIQNMADDLEVGYTYFGACIQRQKAMIDEYKKCFDEQMDVFKAMEEKAVNRWCFYDLKKRGAIE